MSIESLPKIFAFISAMEGYLHAASDMTGKVLSEEWSLCVMGHLKSSSRCSPVRSCNKCRNLLF